MSSQQQQTSIVVVSPNNREAKKVVDYKIFNGKRYYKVKWESSWEPEDSLVDYQYLVDQFWDFVKRVSSEDSDDPVRKRPRLNRDENGSQDDGSVDDSNANNSEEDIPIKGTITLSEGVKIQESGNFYRLTQEKDTGEENDGSVFIVQGSHSPLHSIKNTQSRVNKGNVHVIGLQHDPKSESSYARKHRHSEDGDGTPSFISFTLTPTDKALYWDNPYVCIAFFCRFCKEEQAFDLKQENWKEHFKSHVVGNIKAGLEQKKMVVDDRTEIQCDEDLLICNDPDVPWIQKVERIIQKWGINQYMRIAFLCRVCGKEQQAHHTGNWRNHHQSHSQRNSECDICGKVTKNKHHICPHTCQICGRAFKRKIEVKKHIAESHNIDPEHLCAEMEGEDEKASLESVPATSTAATSTASEPLIVNITSLIKSQKERSSTNKKESLLHTKKAKASAVSKIVVPEEKLPVTKTPSVEPRPPSTKSMPRPTKSTTSTKSSTKPSNRNFTCGVCSKHCKTKNDLKNHKRVVHCLGQDEETSTYACNKCHQTFHKHIDLTNHTIENHGIEEAIKPIPTVPSAATTAANSSRANTIIDSEMEEERPPAESGLHHSTMAYLSDEREDTQSVEDADQLVIVIKEETVSDNDDMCIDFPVVVVEEKPPSH